GQEQLDAISARVEPLVKELRAKGVSVKFDDRDTQKPGWKFNEYELKGVPLRLAIGMRDMENNTFEVARRDTMTKETVAMDAVVARIEALLIEMQETIYQKALDYRDSHITEVDTFEELKTLLETKGGFVSEHRDGTEETEAKIRELTKARIRCRALDTTEGKGSCIYTDKPSKRRVLFAKAY